MSTPSQAVIDRHDLQPSSENLQLTFLQFDGNRNSLVAINVYCFRPDGKCFGEPVILFQPGARTIANQTTPSGIIDNYDWSPNGEEVVLSASGDLWIGNIDKKTWKNISNSPDVDEYSPLWSHDGNSIYFLACSQELGYGSCKLVRLTLNTNDRLFVSGSIKPSILSFSISPENGSIVYSASDWYDTLFQSDADGLDTIQLTVVDAEETSPDFSPDGGKITFVRSNAPALTSTSEVISDIIVRDINTGQEKNLTGDFEDDAFSPVFSIDGNSVAFDSFDRNLDANIYVALIDSGIIIPITHGIMDETDPNWRVIDPK